MDFGSLIGGGMGGQLMNGTQANTAMRGAAGGGAGMMLDAAQLAFDLVGYSLANKNYQNTTFNPDDLVIEETARDSRAYLVSGATVVLLFVVIYILWK